MKFKGNLFPGLKTVVLNAKLTNESEAEAKRNPDSAKLSDNDCTCKYWLKEAGSVRDLVVIMPVLLVLRIQRLQQGVKERWALLRRCD